LLYKKGKRENKKNKRKKKGNAKKKKKILTEQGFYERSGVTVGEILRLTDVSCNPQGFEYFFFSLEWKVLESFSSVFLFTCLFIIF
jgi:hypothetical protein